MTKIRAAGRTRTALVSCVAALGLLILGELLQPTDSLGASAEPPVKLSRGNICHDATSTHYARLKEYQSFNNMQECIAAGGRPSRGSTKKPDSPIQDALGSVGIGWLLGGAVVVFAIGLLLFRNWSRRRQNQKTQEVFEEAEDRHWRGHRLDK